MEGRGSYLSNHTYVCPSPSATSELIALSDAQGRHGHPRSSPSPQGALSPSSVQRSCPPHPPFLQYRTYSPTPSDTLALVRATADVLALWGAITPHRDARSTSYAGALYRALSAVPPPPPTPPSPPAPQTPSIDNDTFAELPPLPPLDVLATAAETAENGFGADAAALDELLRTLPLDEVRHPISVSPFYECANLCRDRTFSTCGAVEEMLRQAAGFYFLSDVSYLCPSFAEHALHST
jgi:hypothetical protein